MRSVRKGYEHVADRTPSPTAPTSAATAPAQPAKPAPEQDIPADDPDNDALDGATSEDFSSGEPD